jgi:hypothetical protein
MKTALVSSFHSFCETREIVHGIGGEYPLYVRCDCSGGSDVRSTLRDVYNVPTVSFPRGRIESPPDQKSPIRVNGLTTSPQ